MSWMTSIVSWLKSIEEYFYDAYLEFLGWVYPFWLLSYPLLYASRGFGWLAYYFSLFNNWLVWASDELGNILSWDYIKSLIKSWLPKLEAAVSWFLDWWNNVTSVITSWWSATMATVKGWISTAVQPFNAMLTAWNNFWQTTWPGWVSSFNSLKSAWDNFWKETFPSLVSFKWLETWWNSRLKDIDDLVNDKLKDWFPFYDDLVKLWSSITAFFTDPWKWLLDRLGDFMERNW